MHPRFGVDNATGVAPRCSAPMIMPALAGTFDTGRGVAPGER
jgi:hypothetical protein